MKPYPVNGNNPRTPWWIKIVRVLLGILSGIGIIILCVWGSLALMYSTVPWPIVKVSMAVAFSALGIWAFWLNRRTIPRLVFAVIFICVLGWFLALTPSHDREWRTEVGVMPRAIVEGDLVRLTGFRNFDYETRDDFTINYEERVVSLSDISSVDLFISYWSIGPVGHTFVSFNFENSPPVSISIETRPEANEGFDPLASIFRQYELIYVVGDERDLVRSRTNDRDEDVFLYPIKVPPEAARRLFEVYLQRINELADNAEWYNLFKNNCTLNILRYANAAGRVGSFDIRHLINGWVDRYFYDVGMVDTSIPFTELRQRSWINEAAIAADDDLDFSRAIRESLPDQD